MTNYLDRFLQIFGANPYIHVVVLVVAALIVAKLVDLIIGRGLKVWARRTDTDLDDRLLDLIHRPIFLTVLVIGLWLALDQLQIPENLLVLSRRLLGSIVLLTWFFFSFRGCTVFIDVLSHLERQFTAVQPRTVALFEQLSKIILVGAGVYFLFLIWGIDVGALLAAGGIIGIAVGFAAKDSLANLFSGIFITADAPYKPGDFVVLDTGERGEVTQIGLRSTRLLTRDDVEVTVPNAVIANAKIVNESGGRWEKQRVRVKVGVAYGSDIDLVREVLLDVANNHSDINSSPEPRVRFRRFGESGLDFELLGWIHEPVLRGRVVDALNCEVYKRFRQEGIEIPYPKRDVYLHTAAQQASEPGEE